MDVTVTTSPGAPAPPTRRATSSPTSSDLRPSPTVTLVNPAAGPAGTSVTVSGTNFTGVTAVDFGAEPGHDVHRQQLDHHHRHRPGGHGHRRRDGHHRPRAPAPSTPSDQFTYGAGPPPGTIPSPVSGGWQLNGSAQLITTASPPTCS